MTDRVAGNEEWEGRISAMLLSTDPATVETAFGELLTFGRSTCNLLDALITVADRIPDPMGSLRKALVRGCRGIGELHSGSTPLSITAGLFPGAVENRLRELRQSFTYAWFQDLGDSTIPGRCLLVVERSIQWLRYSEDLETARRTWHEFDRHLFGQNIGDPALIAVPTSVNEYHRRPRDEWTQQHLRQYYLATECADPQWWTDPVGSGLAHVVPVSSDRRRDPSTFSQTTADELVGAIDSHPSPWVRIHAAEALRDAQALVSSIDYAEKRLLTMDQSEADALREFMMYRSIDRTVTRTVQLKFPDIAAWPVGGEIGPALERSRD